MPSAIYEHFLGVPNFNKYGVCGSMNGKEHAGHPKSGRPAWLLLYIWSRKCYSKRMALAGCTRDTA